MPDHRVPTTTRRILVAMAAALVLAGCTGQSDPAPTDGPADTSPGAGTEDTDQQPDDQATDTAQPVAMEQVQRRLLPFAQAVPIVDTADPDVAPPRVESVVETAQGLLACTVGLAEGLPLRLLTSTDGRDWTDVSTTGLPDAGFQCWLGPGVGPDAGPDDVVMYGPASNDLLDPGVALWESSDGGTTWQRSVAPPQWRSPSFHVLVHADEAVWILRRLLDGTAMEVWRHGVDGTEMVATMDPGAEYAMDGAAVHDGRLVWTGQLLEPFEDGTGQSLTTPVIGWVDLDSSTSGFGRGVTALGNSAIAVVDGVFTYFAGGARELDDDAPDEQVFEEDVLVFESVDGEAWTRVSHDEAIWGGETMQVPISAATTRDGRVLVVGQEDRSSTSFAGSPVLWSWGSATGWSRTQPTYRVVDGPTTAAPLGDEYVLFGWVEEDQPEGTDATSQPSRRVPRAVTTLTETVPVAVDLASITAVSDPIEGAAVVGSGVVMGVARAWGSVGGMPTLWTVDDDGLVDPVTLDLPDGAGADATATVQDVTDDSQTIVAVGGSDGHLAAWTSTDGQTFTAAPPGAVDGGARLVAATPGGWSAVGTKVVPNDLYEQRRELQVWTSPDGVAWTPADHEPIPSDRSVSVQSGWLDEDTWSVVGTFADITDGYQLGGGYWDVAADGSEVVRSELPPGFSLTAGGHGADTAAGGSDGDPGQEDGPGQGEVDDVPGPAIVFGVQLLQAESQEERTYEPVVGATASRAGDEWEVERLPGFFDYEQPLVQSDDGSLLVGAHVLVELYGGDLVAWYRVEGQWLHLPWDAAVMGGDDSHRPVGIVTTDDGVHHVVGERGQMWAVAPG